VTYNQSTILFDKFPFDTSKLELVEQIYPSTILPGKEAANDTIAECVLEWNQGTTFYTDNLESIHCDINTARHWHIFETWKQEKGLSVYCRGARVAACNQGIAFAQNMRIIVQAGSEVAESHMADDNLAILKKRVVIDTAKFNSD
jgi:hypothetical protein